MMRLRQAMPSASGGMLMSSVTTSGFDRVQQFEPFEPVRPENYRNGSAGENAAEKFAHKRRVVDHKRLDHECARALLSKACSSPRSAPEEALRRIKGENDAPFSCRD